MTSSPSPLQPGEPSAEAEAPRSGAQVPTGPRRRGRLGRGGTIALLTAATMVSVGTVTAGGYLAVDMLDDLRAVAAPEPSPPPAAQAVSRAADLVVAAESFRASAVWAPNEDAIRRANPGIDDQELRSATAFAEDTVLYNYTSSPVPAFEELPGVNRAYRNIDGELYVTELHTDTWRHNPPSGRSYHNNPDRYTVAAFVEPLRTAARAPDLTDEGPVTEDETPGRRYTGSFRQEDHLGSTGEAIVAPTPFELVIGDDGYPLRLGYTTADGDYELVFKVFGEPVSVEAPAPGTVLTDLEICGPVPAPYWLEADLLDVSASTSEVGCATALDVSLTYVSEEGEPPPRGGGSGWAATVDGWSCRFLGIRDIDLAVAGRPLGECTLPTGEAIDLLTAE